MFARLSFMFLVAGLLGACGTMPLNTERINSQFKVSEKADESAKFFKKIRKVSWSPSTVNGKEVTKRDWTQALANDEVLKKNKDSLTEILTRGLESSDLLDSAGPYYLKVVETHEKHPGFGIDMIVIVKIVYNILAINGPDDVVHEEVVESEFSASPSDSIIGVQRNIIATEGAFRKNLELLIERLIYR